MPSGQGSQRLTLATDPCGHWAQAAEPCAETLPGAHLAHWARAGLDEKVPSWQGSQRDRLLAGVDTAPPGHCWHSSLERTETDPGGQAEQADFFEEGL